MRNIKKKEIIFDPEKRKNFLTGFRKRKNERRARAKEQLERSIKEERKRIRNDVKNCMASMKKTFQPLHIDDPELADKYVENDYEDEEVQINVIELASGGTSAHVQDDEDNDSDTATNAGENSADQSYINSIPGMDFKVCGGAATTEPKVKKSKTNNREKEKVSTTENFAKIGNKKMLDKFKKQKALKEIKKSKVFKQKERIEKKKQQKSRKDKKFGNNKNGAQSTFGGGNKNRQKGSKRRGHANATNRGRRK